MKIKFRAWDIENKKWFKPIYNFSNGIVKELLLNDRGSLILREYNNKKYKFTSVNLIYDITFTTGLHDKNGKEIYEGDIVKHIKYNKPFSSKRKKTEVISMVAWFNGGQVKKGSKDWELNKKKLEEDMSAFTQNPMFTTKEIKNDKGYRYSNWSDFAGCEVIGNIFEDKHLLK